MACGLPAARKIQSSKTAQAWTVIGYRLRTADQNGGGPVHQMLLAFSAQPEGIPDGGAIYVRGNRIKSSGEGLIISATLQSVIFADGQFVGMDEHGDFGQFVERIKAIRGVGILAKAGAWDQIESLAQALTKALSLDRLSAAARLIQERREKGDAAAGQLAELYSSLPNLWK